MAIKRQSFVVARRNISLLIINNQKALKLNLGSFYDKEKKHKGFF